MTELMDWYFGNATADELVVPKEQDLSDRLPSPDSWLQWGRSPSESFGSQNKYFVTETKPTREELNLDGMSLCDEVGMELYNQELEQSSGSSICGGLSGRSPHKTRRSHDRPDYQLDDLAEMDQMDDIFLSSLLEEEVPGMENFRGSFCSSSRPHCAMTPADNLLSDMILDSQSISGDLQGTGSSKYLKTHDFSPPVDWENGGVSDSHFIPCNMGQKVCPPVKALSELVLVPAELSSANECVYEETSVEESVLQDLEMVMAHQKNSFSSAFNLTTMPTRSKFTGKSIPSANRWTRSHVNPICKSKEGKAKGTPKKTRTLRVIDGRSASNFGGFSAARLLDYMANDNYLDDDDDFDYEDEVSDAYSGSGWETRSQTRSIELGYDNSTVGSHYFEEEEVESTGVDGDLNLNGVSCVGILNYTASVDDPVEDSVHDADEALVDLEENETESTVLDEIEDDDHTAADEDEDEDDDDPADEDAEYDDDPTEEVEEYSAEEDGEDDMSFCEVGFVVDQIDGDEEWCLVEEM